MAKAADNRSPGRRRGCLSWLIVTAIALALLEATLQFWGLTDVVLYDLDEAAGWRLEPEQSASPAGVEVVVNAWGVRDPRRLDPAFDGTRILVLGDSVTWGGVRIPQEALFTARLEAALEDAQVVNAGVNGYSVGQMAGNYRAHLADLEPDLVIVYAIPRDFSRAPEARLTGDSIAFPLEQPAFATPVAVQLARIHLARRGLQWLHPGFPSEPVDPDLEDSEAVDRNIAMLEELRDGLGPGQRLAVVFSPQRPGTSTPGQVMELGKRLDEVGIAWYHLRARMGVDETHFTDAVHLSEAGHAAVAEGLAELLVAEGLVGDGSV